MNEKNAYFENKLTHILQALTKVEVSQFNKYVVSPFFNENEWVTKLFDFYLPYLKADNPITESKESIWSSIYPSKAYNDTKFRRLNSDLLKLLEGYLSYKEYAVKEIDSQLNLIKTVQKRGLEKLQKSSFKQAEQTQKKNPHKNGAYYLNEYLLQIEYSQYAHSQFQRNEQINLGQIADNLDYFYISEKLKYYCELINSKGVFEIDYEMLFSNEILEHLKKHPYSEIPAISIYHKIFLSLTEPEKIEHYRDLCNLLTIHSDKFPLEEARMMYGFAQNYCIKKINNGDQNYVVELFELYKIVLEKKVIFINKTLSPWDYKNIVTVGIRIKEFEWTEKFIHHYKSILPKDFRENAHTFNLSKLYFSKKEFGKVISLLQSVEYQDIFYMLDSKATLLKSFYELKEFETLSRLLDSFKILLTRKKVISEQYRVNYLNLVKHTQKLIDFSHGKEKKLIQLKEEIKADSNVADLGWLKEKVMEIEKL